MVIVRRGRSDRRAWCRSGGGVGGLGQAQDADREVAQGSHDAGTIAGANLGSFLVIVDVAQPAGGPRWISRTSRTVPVGHRGLAIGNLLNLQGDVGDPARRWMRRVVLPTPIQQDRLGCADRAVVDELGDPLEQFMLVGAVRLVHRAGEHELPMPGQALGLKRVRDGRDGYLLFVRAPQRHPVSGRPQHRLQIVQASHVVVQRGRPDRAHQPRWIGGIIALHRGLRRPRRRVENSRISLRPGSHGVSTHGTPCVRKHDILLWRHGRGTNRCGDRARDVARR
jgi:hypothetical protein